MEICGVIIPEPHLSRQWRRFWFMWQPRNGGITNMSNCHPACNVDTKGALCLLPSVFWCKDRKLQAFDESWRVSWPELSVFIFRIFKGISTSLTYLMSTNLNGIWPCFTEIDRFWYSEHGPGLQCCANAWMTDVAPTHFSWTLYFSLRFKKGAVLSACFQLFCI